MKLSTINTLLAQVRRERGISQTSLAALLNVEQAAVSQYENGKRSVSLDLLERWAELLDIEIVINPKGFAPVKDPEAVQEDLSEFEGLKRRRNYLIAEMRSMAAVRVMQEPRFRRAHPETGEDLFWVYAFRDDATVGVVETRCDHPSQRQLAVDYTAGGVSVYRFMPEDVMRPGGPDRAYWLEDDFLTLGSFFTHDMVEAHRRDVLRADATSPEGVELVSAEGFAIRSLLEMQENHKCLSAAFNEVAATAEHRAMRDELAQVEKRLEELIADNRLGNGQPDPSFEIWTVDDEGAVSVPLNDDVRAWYWVDEGVNWVEHCHDEAEVRLAADGSSAHEGYEALLEDDKRVVCMIGGCKPALLMFKSSKPGVLFRVEVRPEDLSEEELVRYEAMLSQHVLDELRD